MQSDLQSKFDSAIEGMDPRVGKMLMASACTLANAITGGDMKPSKQWPPTPEDLQCLAVALTALNSYREKELSERAFDLEFDDPRMIATMMMDIPSDPTFIEFLNGQEMESPEVETEVEEVPAMEDTPSRMMDRRSAFLGAM